MSIRDAIFTTAAVALSGLALAGILGTDAYSAAAGAEARGRMALAAHVETGCIDACQRLVARNMAQARAGGRP